MDIKKTFSGFEVTIIVVKRTVRQLMEGYMPLCGKIAFDSIPDLQKPASRTNPNGFIPIHATAADKNKKYFRNIIPLQDDELYSLRTFKFFKDFNFNLGAFKNCSFQNRLIRNR